MYSLIRKAVSEGNIKEYFPLLQHPVARKWIAHQLVENAELPKEVEDSCFSIVEELAENGDPADALGERYWLQEWNEKKGRT